MNAVGAMRVFRDSLIRWIPYIQRATHINDVSIELRDRDVVVSFRAGDFSHEHRFTVQTVYGYVGTRPIHPHQKVCRFADDAILSVLGELKERNEQRRNAQG